MVKLPGKPGAPQARFHLRCSTTLDLDDGNHKDASRSIFEVEICC